MDNEQRSQLQRALSCLIAAQSNVMEAKYSREALSWTKEDAINRRDKVVVRIVDLVGKWTAHIEELEAENARLRDCLDAANRRYEWMAARYHTFRALSGIGVIKDGDSQ